MLYRSLGTSVRADRPLDTNSHSPSGDEASPGNRPETPTMAIGAVASPKVSPMPVSGTRVRNQPVVRSGWWWEWECEDGVHRTQVRAFFVCMKRCNFAAVFNAHNAMRTEITRGRTRIAKRARQRLRNHNNNNERMWTRWGEGRWQDSQGHACNKSSSIMLNTHAGQSTRVVYPR